MSAVLSKIDVANHMEVIVVDVDNFNRVVVDQSVWEGPADNASFGVIDCAFVVSVVQLSGSDKRNDSRRIDVVGDFFLDHGHIVSLNLVQEWDTTLN